MSASKPEVSICIPTYNGERRLGETLDSLVAQWEPGLEIVVCDDQSKDGTLALARRYAAKHSCIKVFANGRNLGMDLNFRQAALHAASPYTWLSGQDDLFDKGVVRKVLEILRSNSNIGVIYLNYSQHTADMSDVLCASVLHEMAVDSQSLPESEDLVFRAPETARQYFERLQAVPSFLPATIIWKGFWEKTDLTAYVGTHYIQVALMLLNMNERDFYVVTKPLIRGRIPDDGWQSKGQSYFNTMLGSFATEAMVYHDRRNPFPRALFLKRKRRFLRSFFALVRESKRRGMQPTELNLKHLKAIFGDGVFYRTVIAPLVHTPFGVLDGSHRLYSAGKRLLFRKSA